MKRRFSMLLISLGGVSGILGGINWYVANGETAIGAVLAIVGLGLILARRELAPNGRLHTYQ